MSETEQAGEEAVGTETLPLDSWHRAKGGRMVEFAGYWMPIQYEGIMAEHLWVRENAGLFDVSHMGQLALSGDDVAAALAQRGERFAFVSGSNRRDDAFRCGAIDYVSKPYRPDDIRRVIERGLLRAA